MNASFPCNLPHHFFTAPLAPTADVFCNISYRSFLFPIFWLQALLCGFPPPSLLSPSPSSMSSSFPAIRCPSLPSPLDSPSLLSPLRLCLLHTPLCAKLQSGQFPPLAAQSNVSWVTHKRLNAHLNSHTTQIQISQNVNINSFTSYGALFSSLEQVSSGSNHKNSLLVFTVNSKGSI